MRRGIKHYVNKLVEENNLIKIYNMNTALFLIISFSYKSMIQCVVFLNDVKFPKRTKNICTNIFLALCHSVI